MEKNILKRRYTFSKVSRVPGYPTLELNLFAGPYEGESTDEKNYREIKGDYNVDTHPNLFETFTVRGGTSLTLPLLITSSIPLQECWRMRWV